MQKTKLKPDAGAGRLLLLPPEQIRSNPDQPRRYFDRAGLEELAASIAQHGILQPLTVRRQGSGYVLVAGERRLRAAKMAGLREVPCLLLTLTQEESGLAALIENLQRRDLDCWEQAEGIARLMRLYAMSQEQVASKLGISPSAVANKLRLLKHSPVVRAALREHGLSERHARALLRLPEEDQRLEAIGIIVRGDLNVAKTEALVEAMLTQQPKPKPKRKMLVRDLRLFLNSVDRHLETLKQAGFAAGTTREETPTEIVLTIHLPKQQQLAPQKTVSGTCETAGSVV
ncbi:MAG: ParB/RepB/Spo0J family partition protein [Oscillospiraceae bacterium]|nr:ParB/RepB/Spo0J family partition protein [Oscillospiraceae bacterium]